MKKSLYQISKEALELAEILEEGEITSFIETALTINQNELQEKSINYAYVIKTMDSDVSAIDEEIKRLTALKKAKLNTIDRLKESILNAMQIYSIEKIETPTLKLSLRNYPVTEVLMDELIDEKFVTRKEVVTIDKKAIKKAIESGENVEGATIQDNWKLQIK